MSSGDKIPLTQAQGIANTWIERLRPFCQRVEVAGSIRRQKPEVGDIELCAIPAQAGTFSLYGTLNAPQPKSLMNRNELAECKRQTRADAQGWLKAKALELARSHGRPIRVKGEFPGRYVQLALPEGTCLDLFLCTLETWGLNFTIRTGSADFSHALAAHSRRKGYVWEEGRVYRRGEDDKPTGYPFDLPEEEYVFAFFGVRWVQPEDRVDEKVLWEAVQA